MPETQVPIRGSVGGAFAFVRENLGFVLIVSVIGAVASTLIGIAAVTVPQLGFITIILSTLVQAFVYAALVAAALFGGGAARMRWSSDGGRVWAAMAIVGLLLMIVMFVAGFIVSIVLVVGPMSPYLGDLQTAGSDNAAVLEVMTRFAEQQPFPLLLAMLFLGAIWFLLTSRLYLAAPASVDQQRILSIETWKWTKGAMLRITGARLLLLAPAYVLVFAISQLLGRLLGIDPFDPVSVNAAASGNTPIYLIYVFVSSFVSLGLYAALEAGLSAYLYRGLKPADASPAV